jgi:enoyl-CoA hydratase
MSDAEPVVLVDVQQRVATVTLNRPKARNALSSALLELLERTLADLEASPDVDVMILTGADPAFCAGLDLRELGGEPLAAGDGDEPPKTLVDRAAGGSRSPFPPRTKPLIGAINGVAVTGGLELALNCDFLIASERARFGDTHARVGIMPGWGLSFLLSEAVGLRRARQMSATGDFVDAEQALTWGLVNMVVPHADLLATTRQVAESITSCDQQQVRTMRRLYDEVAGHPIDAARALEDATNRSWGGGAIDAAEVARRRDAVISRGRSQG